MHVSELGSIEVNEAPPPLELTPLEMAVLADELMHDHAACADLDDRAAQAHWACKSRQGLLRPLERTSIEPLALALDGGHVQAMPPLLGQGPWQDTARRRTHGALGDETLGAADGVWSTAGADVPQPGEPSVGVARQWCGHVGKVEHGQAGVCAASASRNGDTRRDRRLERPEAWCDAAHRARWQQGGIPEETPFTTTPAVALEMRRAVVAAGTRPGRWVACEEAFGRAPAVLDGVAAVPRW